MRHLFKFVMVVIACGSFSQEAYSKTTDHNIEVLENPVSISNDMSKCTFGAKVVHLKSIKACFKSGVSSGRLNPSDCVLWAFLDANDFYYQCIIENTNGKF